MSLYYEAAGILEAPNTSGGSLKSRIFSKKDFKSAPAQIYALVIETCKWSAVLKEIIEKSELLKQEPKLTPILSLLLTHDLLLARRGISLPAIHGLRASVERHKARLTSEFTRARVRRGCGTHEAFVEYVEAGLDNEVPAIPQHPRWIRINTLRTTLEEQLETTFKNYEHVSSVTEVQKRGSKKLFIDEHIPNLVAVPPNTDLIKDKAYTSGALIFQDKASCFPAYLLDPTPEDGDVIDSCAAPGNKTTHVASIVASHSPTFKVGDPKSLPKQTIHAFEKDKFRSQTLTKMVGIAGSDGFTRIRNQDFLKVKPNSEEYKNVGALLLDPSCSGSGIVGRDDMPELHLPSPYAKAERPSHKPPPKFLSKTKKAEKEAKAAAREAAEREKREAMALKRKNAARKDEDEETGDGRGDEVQIFKDDDGNVEKILSGKSLEERLDSLADFQLELVLHAMKFPAAKKITYSTCSVHMEENENVVLDAIRSDVAKARGWRVLKREEQVEGMKEWMVRGTQEFVDDNQDIKDEFVGPSLEDVKEACIRAHKGDGRGTMGFFVCAFVRDGSVDGEIKEVEKVEEKINKRGANGSNAIPLVKRKMEDEMDVDSDEEMKVDEDEEWGGISDEETPAVEVKKEVKKIEAKKVEPLTPKPTPSPKVAAKEMPKPAQQRKSLTAEPPKKKRRQQKKKN